MAHLAEDTAIRARDALDGQHGAVRIVRRMSIVGRAAQVDVLGRNLAVVDQLVQQLLALPTKRPSPWLMAIGVHVADVALASATGILLEATRVRTSVDWWRPIVLNVSVGQLSSIGTDLAVGDQAQLDERLEAVADAQHQAVALFEQLA